MIKINDSVLHVQDFDDNDWCLSSSCSKLSLIFLFYIIVYMMFYKWCKAKAQGSDLIGSNEGPSSEISTPW